MILALRWPALAARLRSPAQAEELCSLAGVHGVLVDLKGADDERLWPPPCPVIAVGGDGAAPELVDVAANAADVDALGAAIERHPLAAAVLVGLLRRNGRTGVADDLFSESLAYSCLQQGAEFQAWLAARPRRAPKPDGAEPPVLLTRNDDLLRIALNRPAKRNAYSTSMRDALCEALALVAEDASIRKAELVGAGACFSAGGDLQEFGAAADAAVAHAARTTRSAGALLHRLRRRVEARLHGACIGAGIELPAFCDRVVARPDAFFQLPEVGMGLIPGAGGTASIPRRIGRRRFALMALGGQRVDAPTALRWGLVDAVTGSASPATSTT